MKRILFFTVLCVSFLTLEAQTITWTGAGDGTNWSDFNNWDLSMLPTDSHDVIIPDGSKVTIDQVAYSKSIEVQGASTLTINHSLQIFNNSLFSENTLVNWRYGGLLGPTEPSRDKVVITNYGTMNIDRPEPSFYSPTIFYLTFKNEGLINFINGSLIVGTASVLNNQPKGIIDLGEDSFGIGNAYGFGLCCGVVNNYGTILKTKGVDVTSNIVEVNNYGVIVAMSGTIKFLEEFQFYNSPEGIIKGTASIDISELTNYSNEGAFSPGASPGTLTFIGDFTSSPSSKIDIELNGLNQGVEYDHLAIQGDAVLDGIVDVTMGFEGNINDEFTVVTTTGTINSCNLPMTTTAQFNGRHYDFSVECKNDDKLVLTIMDIALSVDTNQLSSSEVLLFPNPVDRGFILKNNGNEHLISAVIIDLNGRIVKEYDLSEMEKEQYISLSNYASGKYLIKIKSETQSITKYILKL